MQITANRRKINVSFGDRTLTFSFYLFITLFAISRILFVER